MESQGTFDPTEEAGSALETPGGQGPEAPPEEGVADSGEPQAPTVEQIQAENLKLQEQLGTLTTDRDKLLKFHEEVSPHIPLLTKLKGAFDGEPEKAEDVPLPPPEIMAQFQSPDPNIRFQALAKWIQGIGKSAVAEGFTEREDKDREYGQQARDKYGAQRASLDVLSNHEKYKEVMAWGRPHMERIMRDMQYNEQMAKDWAWLNTVPDEIYGASFLTQIIGSHVLQNFDGLKDALALGRAVENQNARAMDSASGKGAGGLGGKPSSKEDDIYGEVADDLTGGGTLK